MEYTEHYDNLEERAAILADYASQDLRNIHDTFDADWQRGDEPHGTLTFTDIMPEQALVVPVRDFGAEIDILKVKVLALEKR